MFNCFKRKVDFGHAIDLNKITTIEECRDMIIILTHNINRGSTTNIITLSDKAILDYPSLTKLKL